MAGCKVMASRQKELRADLAGMTLLPCTSLPVHCTPLHPVHPCTPLYTSLVHRHGLNMRVKVSSALPTLGPGPMMLLCRPPPRELFSATRTNFVSGAVLVLQPALPVQYYSSLAVHAKIGGDKIVGASVLRVQGPSQAKPSHGILRIVQKSIFLNGSPPS